MLPYKMVVREKKVMLDCAFIHYESRLTKYLYNHNYIGLPILIPIEVDYSGHFESL